MLPPATRPHLPRSRKLTKPSLNLLRTRVRATVEGALADRYKRLPPSPPPAQESQAMHNLTSPAPANPPCPRCIITGCTLIYAGTWQSGDLFELGDIYIFNAVGEPQYEGEPFYERAVILADIPHQTYFERRDVFVFAKSAAALNDKAKAYLAGAPR